MLVIVVDYLFVKTEKVMKLTVVFMNIIKEIEIDGRDDEIVGQQHTNTYPYSYSPSNAIVTILKYSKYPVLTSSSSYDKSVDVSSMLEKENDLEKSPLSNLE